MSSTADRMLVYTDSRLDRIVSLALHFDDTSVEKAEFRRGDIIACKYVHQKRMIALQGKVLEVLCDRNNQVMLKVDVSNRYHSGVVFIMTDNIRGFLSPQPDSFIKFIDEFNKESGDIIDTFEEVVEQLEWHH